MEKQRTGKQLFIKGMLLKILLISHNFSPFVGGIESISKVFAQHFTNKGHKVHLLTWTRDSRNDTENYPYKVVRDPGIKTLFKEHNWADFVFENNPSIRLSWPAIFYRKPSIISLQTWVAQINGKMEIQDKLKLKWLKRADKVVACSTAIRKKCFSEAMVIPNPYQENNFQVKPSIIRNKEFVFLGRMVSDKGARLAIEAFHKVVQNLLGTSGLRLTMIGEGPEKTKLENLALELKLENSVKFKGCLQGEALVDELNQHRFILVPSLWEEPFGIVALEGMACGCVPVVSDGGGLPDAIGKGGLTFRRGDVAELASCMLRILQDEQLEKELRARAAEHLSRHKTSVIAQRYLQLIENICQKKGLSNIQKVSI
ncbi:glycosyltransferase family 4 protein [Gramella lutea]|uniref:Glycosyltransferase family 4 protein n=1 Tax=Christiangramia lutea TaxID=1607951 RepID=A0A9X2AB46_9FLAO|nr:glycosyltransferase family 4 protein [Christiangramia lutea]MCH4822763.1 glycosyltransferase family 4 protein [Christiangramia lutea]